MSNYNRKPQQYRQYSNSGDVVRKTASDVLQSGNPAKWVAGIAIGTIAVAGLAIKAIESLNNGKD